MHVFFFFFFGWEQNACLKVREEWKIVEDVNCVHRHTASKDQMTIFLHSLVIHNISQETHI